MRLGEFERVFDLFDDTDDAVVAAARERWTAAKTAGHTLTYWQQGPRGWEKKV
jgi:DNA polymerase III subunit chi